MFKHLKQNNQTYLKHFKFAWVVAFNMLFSVCFFLVHGVFPFFPIPTWFNLENMTRKMRKWDARAKVKKITRNQKK